MDLNAEYYDLEYNNTKKYITELIKKNNNKIIRSFLNSKNQPLDLVLKDN
jgi:3-dehydroquinate dehydratase